MISAVRSSDRSSARLQQGNHPFDHQQGLGGRDSHEGIWEYSMDLKGPSYLNMLRMERSEPFRYLLIIWYPAIWSRKTCDSEGAGLKLIQMAVQRL